MVGSTNPVHITNLGPVERWASVIGGAALIGYSVKKGSGRTLPALLGADLLYRGVTGYSPLYNALGVRPKETQASIPYRQGIHVNAAITIQKSPEEVYEFWRNLENLPRFLPHLHSVTRTSEKVSHWIAQGPAGKLVEWDAEIIGEEPNELLSWRSLPGGDVRTAGSVHFKSAPGGRGTEVTVELQYIPPAGPFGTAFAKLMGKDPADQVRDDLRRLKQVLETGETATTAGQPTGRELLHLERPPRARRVSPGEADAVETASEQSFPASDAPSWTA